MSKKQAQQHEQPETETEEVTEQATEETTVQDAAAFAESVMNEAGLNEPDEAEAQAQAEADAEAEEMNRQGSEMAAMMMVETIEQTLKGFVHPRFTFEQGVKQTAIERYTPIIIKYGPRAMVLFGQWQDEIQAGLFTATLIGASAKQVKQLKAEDAAAVRAAREREAQKKEDKADAAEATQ